ncbi:MAG TPA: nucleotide exchange factor GrpE [Planctomycetota bacterium]|nr:nucleotide exchange factor GrpE [Planctomycetota bacterium]
MSFFHRNMKPGDAKSGDAKSDEAKSDDASAEMPEGPAEEESEDSLADEDSPADDAAFEELTRERDDYRARWQRAQADFQNLRRRTQSDIDVAVRRSQQSLLDGLLLAIDQLDLALAAPRAGAAADQLARGVEMTRAELLRTLATAGVRPMADLTPGDRFDPALHQAVASIPSDERDPGTIVEVVRTGYSWGELVLRAAQVVVASAAVSADLAESDQDG